MAASRIARTVQGPEGLGRVLLKTLLVAGVAVILVSALLIGVGGRPPRDLTISAGAEGGAYHGFAERSRLALARRGFRLHILETAGSVENVGALRERRADIALVQSGTDQVVDMGDITALSELFYEPVWIWAERVGRLSRGLLRPARQHRVRPAPRRPADRRSASGGRHGPGTRSCRAARSRPGGGPTAYLGSRHGHRRRPSSHRTL